MTDLISWLRHMAKPWRGAPNYYAEAADEIERLTQTAMGKPNPKPVAETVLTANAPADTRDCPECGEMLAHHHGSAAYPECWYCTDDNCDYVD